MKQANVIDNFDQHNQKIIGYAIKLLTQYNGGALVGVGNSPAWIIEAAALLSTDSTKFLPRSIPYSGSVLELESKQSDGNRVYSSNEPVYCADSLRRLCADSICDPASVVARYQTHKLKTTFVDSFFSGQGIVSFIAQLSSWANADHINPQFLEAINIHLYTSAEEPVDITNLEIKSPNVNLNIKPQVTYVPAGDVRVLLDSSQTRIVPHLEPHAELDPWQAFSIDLNGTEGLRLRSLYNMIVRS